MIENIVLKHAIFLKNKKLFNKNYGVEIKKKQNIFYFKYIFIFYYNINKKG